MATGGDARPKYDGPTYVAVPEWILLSELSPLAKTLYAMLAAHVNRQRGDRKAWPSTEVLAKMLGFSKRHTVAKYVAELEAFGAIEVNKSPASAKRNHVYTVNERPPQSLSGPETLADWYERHYAEVDAQEAPAAVNTAAGTATPMADAPAAATARNRTNQPDERTTGTTPRGEHDSSSRGSQNFANATRKINVHRPRQWPLLTPGGAASQASRTFAACLEAADRPVYDWAVKQVGHAVKALCEQGADREEVWRRFVLTVDLTVTADENGRQWVTRGDDGRPSRMRRHDRSLLSAPYDIGCGGCGAGIGWPCMDRGEPKRPCRTRVEVSTALGEAA